MTVTATDLVYDLGSIAVFRGITDDGNVITFGVDHRMAEPLAEALLTGEQPCEIEGWQILSRSASVD